MIDHDLPLEEQTTSDLLRWVAPHADGSTLLEYAGSLEHLARAAPDQIVRWLRAPPPSEKVRRTSARRFDACARAIAAAFELGRRFELERARPLHRITSPDDVVTWARPKLAYLAHEELWLLALDARGGVRASTCIARGGLHGASVTPADPLRVALRTGASAFVLVHNHPSGDPTPSEADVIFTAKLATAANAVGLTFVDHVIVSRSGSSFVDPTVLLAAGSEPAEPVRG